MEPAGGMTEVFRKNKRGVAAKPCLDPTRCNSSVYVYLECNYEYNL